MLSPNPPLPGLNVPFKEPSCPSPGIISAIPPPLRREVSPPPSGNHSGSPPPPATIRCTPPGKLFFPPKNPLFFFFALCLPPAQKITVFPIVILLSSFADTPFFFPPGSPFEEKGMPPTNTRNLLSPLPPSPLPPNLRFFFPSPESALPPPTGPFFPFGPPPLRVPPFPSAILLPPRDSYSTPFHFFPIPALPQLKKLRPLKKIPFFFHLFSRRLLETPPLALLRAYNKAGFRQALSHIFPPREAFPLPFSPLPPLRFLTLHAMNFAHITAFFSSIGPSFFFF